MNSASKGQVYEISMRLKVKDHDGNEKWFGKIIKLAFLPFIGLEVLFEKSESGNSSCPIKSVIWNEWSNIFVCEVSWRHPPNSSGEEGYWSLNTHSVLAQADGWEEI